MKLQDFAAAAAQGGPLDYQQVAFDYTRHADQDAPAPVRRPVVVVGGGPVGLALAIDLARKNVPVVVLEGGSALSTGSRAICFAKRTLEIFDRLGCAQPMVDKGVSWKVGRVYFGGEEVYRFDLLPEAGHERPAFINLQQYYVEGYLVQRAATLPGIDLRWRNKVTGLVQGGDGARLTIETPEGSYELDADYVAACDGSRSQLRALMGQESKGRVFRDRFLIADITMDAPEPPPGRPKAAGAPSGGSEPREAGSVGALPSAPSRAETPKSSGTPPTRKPGARPQRSRIQASIDVVVVLPWVPATASTCRPCSTCSASHCGPLV